MNHENEPSDDPPRIEVRVIGGGAPAGWEQVETPDEVVRLVKTGVAGVRSVEDVEPLAEVPAAARRRRRGWDHRSLTIGLGLLMAALILGAFAGVRWMHGRETPGGSSSYAEVEVDRDDDRFLKRTLDHLGEARRQLAVLAETDDPAAAAAMIRGGAGLLPLLERRWRPPRLGDAAILGLGIEVRDGPAGREWVELAGDNDALEAVRFVFVAEEGGLRYDWAASVGANPTALADVPDGAEGEFRVEVRSDTYYDSSFPEAEHLCVRIEEAAGGTVAWAYAPRDSAAAAVLGRELQIGGTILEEAPMARMILRLRRAGGAAGRQFELIGVVSTDWIRWEEAK